MVSHWYEEDLNTTLTIILFSHVIIVIISVKTRNPLSVKFLSALLLGSHDPQISNLHLWDIFEGLSDSDWNNATNEDLHCNIDNAA